MLSMDARKIRSGQSVLSKDVLEKIEKAKKDIIAGDLVVPKNQEEFEEKYGDVYELD